MEEEKKEVLDLPDKEKISLKRILARGVAAQILTKYSKLQEEISKTEAHLLKLKAKVSTIEKNHQIFKQMRSFVSIESKPKKPQKPGEGKKRKKPSPKPVPSDLPMVLDPLVEKKDN